MDTHKAITKRPMPTGTPWVPIPGDPATVPVPLPVIIVSVEGPYTEQDRKLWTFLLHAVWDDLDDQTIHELPVKDITRMFRDHNAHWIWESAERLADTKVTWIRLEGDRRYKGVGHLLSAEMDEESRDRGALRFHFPPLLIPILKDPRRFARLRIHFMLALSGKYAVTLYELLESVTNKDTPVLEADVVVLRQWLKVPQGKLTRWQDFRRFAVEPALRQINDNPDGAGFTVTWTPLKDGRAITRVRFVTTKTEARRHMEAAIRARERQPHRGAQDALPPGRAPADGDVPDVVQALGAAGLSAHDAGKIWQKQFAAVDADKRPQGMAFETYIQEKIDLLRRQDRAKITSTTGFLLRAIKENYANPALRKEQQAQVYADTSQAIKRLEREKEDLERERNQAFLAVCGQLAEAHPTMLDEAVEAALQAQKFLQTQYDRTLTPLENYRKSLSLAACVNGHLAAHFPEEFTAYEETYQKPIAALHQRIGDGKEAIGLRRDTTIF